ncbi:MAG: hypothetical protein EZS28_002486 [Streblomastix strix]|uniref:Mitochondrial splicing suppressor 51-like C-terminal domain-containing protein n=1 Tax=Streblomastix strix TaxID=222440 RepID=A0A5J4X4S9_9EUKA|nr:MAG: hypothetical protein EZS28_002486 [Streblomastix strix]
MTIIFVLQYLFHFPKFGPENPNNIYIVGANQQTEEYQLNAQTNQEVHFWGEIVRFFPQAHFNIIFVGPDLSPNCEQAMKERTISDRMNVTFIRSTFDELCRKKKQTGQRLQPYLIVLFNPVLGFISNFERPDDYILKMALKKQDPWKITMEEIGELNVPTLITVRNDEELEYATKYIDQRNLQTKITPPFQKNPFGSPKIKRYDIGMEEPRVTVTNISFTVVQGFKQNKDQFNKSNK